MQKPMYNEQFSALKNAFESSPLPFAILDSELHIIHMNKALSLRYPDITDSVQLYLLFEDVDKGTVLNCLKSEKSYEFSYDLPDQNGAHITLNALFSSDDIPEFIGATAILSPKKASEGVFAYAGDDFECQEAVNRELRDRITMMFSSIYAISQARDFEPVPNICDFINNINQNCYQLLRISDNLSKVLRLSAQNDYAKFELLNFSEYINKLVDTVILMDNKNCVPIEFICEDIYLPVQLDIARMEFAISNIILNAIKYTREGNRIKIILKRVGNNAVLSISDKGAGIPKSVLPKVGTPYFSYSHGDKFVAGFGIGLFIAKKYIAYHAGSFSIQSKENEGTTVTLSIPLDIEKTPDGPVSDLTLHSPPSFEPGGKFSQTSIQLSEVCFYPVL